MDTILMLQTVEPRRIPISELRERSIELDRDEESPEGIDGPALMVTHCVLEEFAIPYEKFSLRTNVNLHLEAEKSMRSLPIGVPTKVEPGVIVAMDGEEWVVVEVDPGAWIALASTRYIDITK